MDSVDVDEHGRVRGVAIHMPYEVHAMDDSNSFDAANTNAFDDTLPVARPLTQAPTMGQGGVADTHNEEHTAPSPNSPHHRLLYPNTTDKRRSATADAATHTPTGSNNIKSNSNLANAGNSHGSPTAAAAAAITVSASVRSFLRAVPHLYTLTVEQIATLPVLVREYAEMSVIVEEGQMLEHVCVLASGTVEVMNSTRGPRRVFGHRRIGSITAPNIFGLEEVILDKPTAFTYHASTTVTLLLLRSAAFLQLFPVSPMFANSVSSHILHTLAPFTAFQDYCRLIFGLVHDLHQEGNANTSSSAAAGLVAATTHRISLPLIIQTYINCGAVSHRYARSSRLDVDALQLCVRRLPANIGETHVLLLTHALPEYIANSFVGDAVAQRQGWLSPSTVAVDTGRRRRCAWRIGGGGQTLIVMRDGFTDPMDLVSNLAMFAVEAKKLQTHMEQLVSPSAMEILSVWLSRLQKQRRRSRRRRQQHEQQLWQRHRSRTRHPCRGQLHAKEEHKTEDSSVRGSSGSSIDNEGDEMSTGHRTRRDNDTNDGGNDEGHDAEAQDTRSTRRRRHAHHRDEVRHTSRNMNKGGHTHRNRDDEVPVYDEGCVALLEQLQFSPREAAGLRATWGDDRVARQLYNLLLHRQEYVVQLTSAGVNSFAHDVYASWSLTILRHLKSCLGIAEEEALPAEGVVIDVVFSPNRTVKNLFCSMRQEYQALIEEASQTLYADSNSVTSSGDTADVNEGSGHTIHANGHAHGTPENDTNTERRHGTSCSGSAAMWRNDEDRSYYILTCLMERDAHVRAAYRARLERNGFALFEDAYPSALLMDCIDVGQLCVRDTDTGLQAAVASAQARSRQSGVRHFVLNIDKTFGAQVESILRALLLSLGNRIRSVNLMGKAAGLMGQRGDVVVPSQLIFSKQSFGEDTTDEIRLSNRNTLAVEDITPYLGQSCSAAVHQGACLTLPSFVLQSESVLKFYKIVHGCVCEEMQSSYIARQLEECHRTGVLHKSIPSRYLFYCNEMPLGNDDGTAIRSCKREIISTIYATARALLRKILES